MESALQFSVYVSSPEFAGWLMKKGFRWRKLWRKRWVALHGAEVVYMEAEPTVENSGTLTITKAEITSATVIDRDDSDGDPNGFAIHFNDGVQPTWHLRAESLREKKSWLVRLAHVHAIVRWLEDFEKVRVLGVGGAGIVFELLHKTNGTRYAMKEMEIKNKTQMKMAVSEAEMLKDIMENVSHPNIMHIERVFQVGSKFYMVFPLCTGGELYEHIIRRGRFTEVDAAELTRQIVSGLHALHEHDILHLDIKPENILFESTDEESIIKITDFGLSKVFSPADQTKQNSAFSMRLMQERLQAFLDTGETYKEQLRGTIGYMSPELILTGHCSKATDVFAAGVVLYILLCGRPPFNSKSNREVLEKTARGVYRISGGEWDAISAEAKDLVQKMLCSNPLERITTAEILAHPWLRQLEDDEVGELGVNINVAHLLSSGVDVNQDNSFSNSFNNSYSKRLASKHSGGVNLAGTLRQLSGHVRQRRSEKMATNLSRIVSSLLQQQEGGGGSAKSTLAGQYLIPTDGSGAASPTPGGKSRLRSQDDSDASELLVLNSDFRAALVAALSSLDELDDGRLTIEQFAAILAQLIGVGSVSGVTTLLMGRFVDRDGDGYISADDIFALQAMLMQKSEVFLRQIAFRVYTEALWYPGRQFNLINAKQQIPRKSLSDLNALSGASSAAHTPIKMTSAESMHDVVEPPKFITARHVAAVFEKMGYDPAAGTKVFGILLDLLAKERAREQQEEEDQVPDGVAAEAETSGTHAGSAAEHGAAGAEEEDNDLTAARASESAARESFFNAPLYARKPRNSFTASLPFGSSNTSSSSANAKMDVNDFVKIVELDDVLVQAFTRRARLRMIQLMRTAEERYAASKRPSLPPSPSLSVARAKQFAAQGATATIAAMTGAAIALLSAPPPAGIKAGTLSAGAAESSPIEIATGMLTEMFKTAVQQVKTGGSAKSTPRQLFS